MRFLRGQILTAKIEDVNRDGSYVCQFNGQLLRVENRTTKKYVVGAKIQLQVVQESPLIFALFEERKNFERRI